jgi:hypothetical protein
MIQSVRSNRRKWTVLALGTAAVAVVAGFMALPDLFAPPAKFCSHVAEALQCKQGKDACLLMLHRTLSTDLAKLKNARGDAWSNLVRLDDIDSIYMETKESMKKEWDKGSTMSQSDIDERVSDCNASIGSP